MLSHAKGNLQQYFDLTNKAELKLIEGKHREAQKLYKEAFLYKDLAFSIDLYNSAITAILLKDKNEAFSSSFKLADRGVNSAFFSKNSEFQYLKAADKNQWDSLLSYAAHKATSFHTANFELKNAISGLIKRDQQVHRAMALNDTLFPETVVKKIDDSISAELMKLFEKNGFLSEFNLGAEVRNDTVLAPYMDFNIIIRHNFQGIVSYDTLFAPICKKAINDGLMHPYEYANLRDSNPRNGNLFFGTSNYYIRYKCAIYLSNSMSKEEKREIDSLRKGIDLPLLSESVLKIKYRIENPNTKFFFRDNYSIMGSFANPESEAMFKKYSIVIVPNLRNCNEQ